MWPRVGGHENHEKSSRAAGAAAAPVRGRDDIIYLASTLCLYIAWTIKNRCIYTAKSLSFI